MTWNKPQIAEPAFQPLASNELDTVNAGGCASVLGTVVLNSDLWKKIGGGGPINGGLKDTKLGGGLTTKL